MRHLSYVAPIDEDGDGEADYDCDDNNSNINPSAARTCNSIDDNCDGIIDPEGTQGLGEWYLDIDGDSFGGEGEAQISCEQPGDITPEGNTYGYVLVADTNGDGIKEFDCDDMTHRSTQMPMKVDEVDNDCDGLIDDEDSDVAGDATWYPDNDEDGFGDDTDPSAVLFNAMAPPAYDPKISTSMVPTILTVTTTKARRFQMLQRFVMP